MKIRGLPPKTPNPNFPYSKIDKRISPERRDIEMFLNVYYDEPRRRRRDKNYYSHLTFK
jgi:hypothetical protein